MANATVQPTSLWALTDNEGTVYPQFIFGTRKHAAAVKEYNARKLASTGNTRAQYAKATKIAKLFVDSF